MLGNQQWAHGMALKADEVFFLGKYARFAETSTFLGPLKSACTSTTLNFRN